MTSILKLMPHEFLHVENTNTCDVVTLVGPITYTLYDHHKRLRANPMPLIVVPPGHYVEVRNPMHPVSAMPQAPAPAANTSSPEANTAAATAGTTEASTTTTPTTSATPPAAAAAAAYPSAPHFVVLRSNPASASGIEEVHYSRWKLPYGSSELRFSADSPFPLLPDEEVSSVQPLRLLSATEALVIEAVEAHDTTDPLTGTVRRRTAQEEFLFRGPGVYTPRLDERVVCTTRSHCGSPLTVFYLTALYDFVDDNGTARVAGERWREQTNGIFFCPPAASLKVQDVWTVPENSALEVETTDAFYDERLKVQRHTRDAYLITRADTEDGLYVPRCGERLVRRRYQVHLAASQYCVVANPISADGAPRLREAEVCVGKQSFIPQPGERVTRVLDVLVLKEDEALLMTALQSYKEDEDDFESGGVRLGADDGDDDHPTDDDEKGEKGDQDEGKEEATTTTAAAADGEGEHAEAGSTGQARSGCLREGGSRWLVYGPRQYIPPIYAQVLERRHIIKLNENEGVYVRNIYSGTIRCVFGKPFMLSAEEELWERPISAYVRRLLMQPRQSLRVDDMSAAEIAEAAVEEGRANIRRGPDAPTPAGKTSASQAVGRAAVLTAATAPTNNAVEESDPSSESYTESDDTEDDDADKDALSFHASHLQKETPQAKAARKKAEQAAEAALYSNTLNLLALAEQNAQPPCQSRDITRFHVISANVEHNTLMRLYDTSTGRSRVVAGPSSVYLEPHEHFTSLSLSGGRPKQPHQIHSLSLYLGPDYMADIIEVETRDHARLRLHLAYNWEFDGVEPGSETGVNAELAFTIADFIGEACKALASRVRSVIASQTFEFFHCNSSTLIRQAIFTSAADGSTVIKDDVLYFTANGLRITTVDVQSVEPVDAKTRIALTKSVQLAVEIITKSQESDASHQAALLEQEAKGALDLQMMRDRAKAEDQRTALLRVMGDNTVLEQAGASRAQALAESEARLAEAQGEVEATPIRCAAHSVGMDAELDVLRKRAELDLAHRAAMNKLAVDRMQKMANVEATKYEQIMSSLGQDTLIAIANAGPELKAQLLDALGLQGFVVTDGSTPINMMDFANQIAAGRSSA